MTKETAEKAADLLHSEQVTQKMINHLQIVLGYKNPDYEVEIDSIYIPLRVCRPGLRVMLRILENELTDIRRQLVLL